jgi:hypothetical protein
MPGPIPNVTTTVIGGGNAAGLFPEITPAPTPSPGPGGTNPAAERSADPAGQAAAGIITSVPATSALGLVALAVAFLLMTRLPVRRRKKGAAALRPEITPAPIPSPVPEGTDPAAERSVSPAGQPADAFIRAPARPALGLIALVVAFLLVVTRLFVRRRINRRGPGAQR